MKIEDLEKNWKDNIDTIGVGREIFEKIANNERPVWASNILENCYNKHQSCVPEIDDILQIAKQRSKWGVADLAFQALRNRRLVEDNQTLTSLLIIAEKTAKITFNASDSTPPYDTNSGWKLVSDARDYCEYLEDDDFNDVLWKSIVERPK